ncbi:MAG: biotin--[acetyl-CoA-carboxylase] ligase [Firmicutes bacterium]|jgi:BirA family biotin operon repressor/biotin-[acetyl-CoA-carboxylase] ligase|nr:biotin--[acetyl-CoA-carboxylase] ligase [Bacillota bacterium]
MKHTSEKSPTSREKEDGQYLSNESAGCRHKRGTHTANFAGGKNLPAFKAERLQIDRIRAELESAAWANRVFFFPSLDSTNRKIYDLALEGAPEGTLILAEEQSAGKGRLGRSWSSLPYRGLWFSLLLRPENMTPEKMAPFTAAAAAIAASGLRGVTGLPVSVKWPNDLLINGKKLGGALARVKMQSHRIHFMILGMGINVNHRIDDFPAELKEKATSLHIEGKTIYDREAICATILNGLEVGYRLFLECGFSAFLELWRELDFMPGQRITVEYGTTTFRGTAMGIDEKGALIARGFSGERKHFPYGEIEKMTLPESTGKMVKQ